MSADALCRVCLVNNLNLYGVRHHLQNVYETLSREKFNEAGYPVRMCYICLSALRKCHRFMETARDANSSLKQFYNQQCQMAVAKPLSIYSVTKVESVSIDSEGISLKHAVKEENLEFEEQSDVDMQADEYQILCDTDDIEIEIKPKIETNDEILSDSKEISKQDRDENDAKNFILENKFEPKSEILKTKRKKKVKKLHICLICNESCTSACSLKRHITVKHPSTTKTKLNPKTTTYSCPDCTFKCIKKSLFNIHLKTHTGEKQFSCDVCSYTNSNKSYLTAHMRTHTGEKPYLCNICSYRCGLKAHLNRHMKIHTGERPFACDICTCKFIQKSSLTDHMRTHTGEKPFSCDICSYKCILKSYLTKHMRIHTGEKPFSCDICGYKTGSKSAFIIHMRSHTGEKPYACDICDYKFIRKDSLNDHMRTHTGEKPFSCKICSYKCATNSTLKQHMKVHTDDRQFSCHICSYSSARKAHLNRHILTHTGEKPFSCEFCGLKFSRKDYFNNHMKTHTGDKLFKCNNCNYTCAVKHRLTKHLLTKHKLTSPSQSSLTGHERGINTASSTTRAQFSPSDQSDSN